MRLWFYLAWADKLCIFVLFNTLCITNGLQIMASTSSISSKTSLIYHYMMLHYFHPDYHNSFERLCGKCHVSFDVHILEHAVNV